MGTLVVKFIFQKYEMILNSKWLSNYKGIQSKDKLSGYLFSIFGIQNLLLHGTSLHISQKT